MSEQRFFDDVAVGDELPPLATTFTPRSLVMFAGAALDFYEIHYDRDAALAQGLDGLLVHGALKNALLGRYLHEYVAPAGRILSFGCQYRGKDRPGEELVCRGHVVARREDAQVLQLAVHVENSDGVVTTPGEADVFLPRRS
jgi:acyl dehydratase